MIEDLQLVGEAPARPAPRRSAASRRRARFGPISLALLALAVVLQVVSLAQQFSYLFAPKPGELAWLIAVIGITVLVGLAGVASGIVGATTPDGRRTGAFGAALGIAFLVLFAAATSFGWGFLEALSTPV
ncbi:hypothetical protein [Agrococcus sp. ProA11]|uniref:hypothetical protein n=1 Tax=Agrococcus chionoecetis TaxID=3153752 RepID=UPI0032602A2E